jgi:hypothetical protein
MNEKLETKKEWVTPEIIDLDVEDTASGDINPVEFSTTAGPAS